MSYGYAAHLGANAYMYPLGVVYATNAVDASAIADEAGMGDVAAYSDVVDDYLAARQRAHRRARAAGARMPRDQRDHLDHMTDGRWHDDCPYCLSRREHGGTGLEHICGEGI